MIDLVFRILYLALWLFDVALLIYVAMSWLRPTANRWTELLRKIVEPVLNPIRRILVEKLPPRWQIFDWSPRYGLAAGGAGAVFGSARCG